MTFNTKWDEEKDTLLRSLFFEKMSDCQIAERMSQTRNSVIARRSRLGLKRGAPRRGRKQKAERIVPVELPRPDISSSDAAANAIMGLTAHQCRYPIGDPCDEDFRFCSAPCGIDQPYCPTHHALCYTTPQERLRGQHTASVAVAA